jgi:ubiquinone/menaquinone biosynthesis C-methylase UbiE
MNLIFKLFPFLNNEAVRIEWVKNELGKVNASETILDAGAGECQYKKFCGHLKYTSQDFAQYDGKGDQTGLQTKSWDNSKLDIVCDIIAIPLETASFNNILCTEVLEHIPSPELAIKEFSRVLKKGGKLILTAPFASYTHFAPYHYATGFNKYWYQEMAKRYDFKIVQIEASGNFFHVLCQEMLRFPMIAKRYTFLSGLSYVFYLPILPLVGLVSMFSFLGTKSSEVANFGYHVVAIKK